MSCLRMHSSNLSEELPFLLKLLEQEMLALRSSSGTGAITIPSKRVVGPSGNVVGVDISGDSLSIAREKTWKESLDIKFIRHDITALQNVVGIEEASFDLITCATAFVLLKKQGLAVKQWAKLLKKGGRVTFDVPTNDSMIRVLVLENCSRAWGPLIYNRTRLESAENVRKLLTDADLDPKESFLTDNYRKVDYPDSEK
jgi:ubiquinone/menaquinone biosynthesis C-methylase UbiE